MIDWREHTGMFLLLLVSAFLAVSGVVLAAEIVTDRAHFIDPQLSPALPGQAVGLLVPELILIEKDGGAITEKGTDSSGAELAFNSEWEEVGNTAPGKSLPHLCFSAGGNSYRAIYLPVMAGDSRIGNGLLVSAGGVAKDVTFPTAWPDLRVFHPPTPSNAGGPARPSRVRIDGTRIYPFLEDATLPKMGIHRPGPYALVELEVNDGDGAATNTAGSLGSRGFAATRVRLLEGSKDYPLDTSAVIAGLIEQHDRRVRSQASAKPRSTPGRGFSSIGSWTSTRTRSRSSVIPPPRASGP